MYNVASAYNLHAGDCPEKCIGKQYTNYFHLKQIYENQLYHISIFFLKITCVFVLRQIRKPAYTVIAKYNCIPSPGYLYPLGHWEVQSLLENKEKKTEINHQIP